MNDSQSEKLIPIRKAAEMLGVSVDTLRRWDKKGAFLAIKTPGGRRYYSLVQIELLRKDLFGVARQWVTSEEGKEPQSDFYCPNSLLFQTRLIRMEKELLVSQDTLPWVSLIVSATGEIGNNSFDHNLGNWRDIPGVFYGYDLRKRHIVLADRGQGIYATLRRVKPELVNDEEALKTAFTEVISGRAPEARGNGLKLVKLIVERYPLSVDFYSGDAKVSLRHDNAMKIEESEFFIQGCLVLIRY